MELDDLKQAWATMDARLAGTDAFMREDYRARHVDKTRSILRRSLLARGLELAAWVVFTAGAATLWAHNLHVPHWLAVGLLLHVYGIAGIWASATQLLLLSRIYLFDAPVVVVQRRLAQLRRFQVWCTLALGLPWWCLWLLVSLAAMYLFTGVDGFAAGSTWIWSCMAVGVVGIGCSVWLARRLARRPVKSAWLRRMIDDMSGRNLQRASQQLDALARFERE